MLVNYLPFNLPLEICEHIFFYLSAKELITCTLVSVGWKEFIAESKCLEKLVLTINENTELESVMQTERCYRNLRLLQLDNEKLINSLSMLGPLAKKIVIFGCCIKERSEQFNFNLLQELTLSNVTGHILSSLTNFHENLKILNLHDLKMKHYEMENVISLLRINENLNEINFYLNETFNIFQQDISSIFRFNLVSITISFKSNFEIDFRTLTNIEQFLVSQGKTLKIISLINAASLSSVYRIWNFLHNVERLNFFSADPFFDCESNRPELEINGKLKSFEIHGLGPLPLDVNDLQPLLKATKNLKSLGVWNLNKEVIEYSAMNLLNLEHLFCATMDNECEIFYEQLKSKNGTNKKIKLHQYL